MRKSRFTEEQIIGIPQEAEAGAEVRDLCRRVCGESFSERGAPRHHRGLASPKIAGPTLGVSSRSLPGR